MSHAKKSANPNDFILPDLGEGVHEAELIKWRVKVGDHVKEHQVLADMETDKALVEVPSPRDGVIATLHGKEGEILHVGNALVSFTGAPGSGGAGVSPAKPEPADAACDAGAQIARNLPAENGKHKAAHSPTPAPTPAAEREDAGTVVGAVGGALGGVTAEAGKALATPAVRRLARDLGINIDAIAGSGIGGRVLEKDVRAAASSSPSQREGLGAAPKAPVQATGPATRPSTPAPRPAPAPRASEPAPARTAPARSESLMPPGQETVRIPFRGVRRTIAARLRESIDQAVHFTVMDEAEVSGLDSLRRKLAAASGEKVSFLSFVAAAVCRCLAGEFAAMNSTTEFREGAEGAIEGEIIRHRAVHLGIATDTENGLMVPVIRDCDKLGVLEISRHIAHVAESARNRSAPREMLMGSTFTISNVGSHAGRFATPVINYPETSILGVGRAREGVVVRHGAIAVGKLLPLSLACDHRVIDGATGALMLGRLIELLQDPEQLMGPARG